MNPFAFSVPYDLKEFMLEWMRAPMIQFPALSRSISLTRGLPLKVLCASDGWKV